jgi:hypothetical protein
VGETVRVRLTTMIGRERETNRGGREIAGRVTCMREREKR